MLLRCPKCGGPALEDFRSQFCICGYDTAKGVKVKPTAKRVRSKSVESAKFASASGVVTVTKRGRFLSLMVENGVASEVQLTEVQRAGLIEVLARFGPVETPGPFEPRAKVHTKIPEHPK